MVKSFFALRRRLAKADVDPHFGLRTSVRQQRPNSATAVTSLHHRRAPRSAAMTTAPGQQHGRAPRAMAVPHISAIVRPLRRRSGVESTPFSAFLPCEGRLDEPGPHYCSPAMELCYHPPAGQTQPCPPYLLCKPLAVIIIRPLNKTQVA